MKETQMIDAVVFDMDGVIFDSEKIYLKCLANLGLDVVQEIYLSELMLYQRLL